MHTTKENPPLCCKLPSHQRGGSAGLICVLEVSWKHRVFKVYTPPNPIRNPDKYYVFERLIPAFGTKRSQVQILSPRPHNHAAFDTKAAWFPFYPLAWKSLIAGTFSDGFAKLFASAALNKEKPPRQVASVFLWNYPLGSFGVSPNSVWLLSPSDFMCLELSL